MKTTIQFIFFVLISNFANSQFTLVFPYDSILKESVQTIFYPFVDGFQLIEVDHIGAYRQDVEMRDLFNPRGLSAAVDIPQPVSNEYFVRDSSGTIIKTYCTDRTIEELNALLAEIPIEKTTYSTRKQQFFAISNQNARKDRIGFYDGAKREGLLYGVINHRGEQVIPVEYQQIVIAENNIFLMQNNKWALTDANQNWKTDFVYDHFTTISLNDSSNRQITYLILGNSFCAFHLQGTNQVVETYCYDRMQTDQYWAKYVCIVVSKNGKYGLIDFEGNILFPTEYDRINLSYDEQCSDKPCIKCVKGTSVEFLETKKL